MRHSILAFSVLLVAGAITPAHADNPMADAETCLKQNPDTGLAACDRLIKGKGRRLTAELRATLYAARGNIQAWKADYAGAITDFSEAINLDPKSSVAYASRGHALNMTGDYDRAIDDLDKAIRFDPGHAYSYANRGLAFLSKKENDRAIRDLSEAIRLDPRYLMAYQNRAIVYFNTGEFDLSIRDCDEAIRLNPGQATSYLSRAAAYGKKGEYDRAITDYGEAIRVDPRSAKAYQGRSFVYRTKGDYDRAIRDDDEAIRINPKSASLYNERGNNYLNKRDYDRAIRDFDESIRLDPNFASAYDSRGETNLAKGDYARAIIDLNEAIRLDSNMTVSFVNRGLAHEKQGDLERAMADFGTALARPAARSATTDQALETARTRLAALRAFPPAPPALAAAIPAPPSAIAPADARPVERSPRVALVIGNGAYRNVPVLGNPSRDAAAVAAALRKVGFQKVIVENDLRKEKLEATLREFGRVAEGSDWALIYYAGHGIEMSGVNYLIPIDARLETDRDVGLETVPLNHVMGAVEGAKKLRLVLLDACRDNPFANQMRRTTASRSIGRGLAPVEPQTGSLVVYAAKDGETALDGDGGNSPFASAFIKELATPGIEIRKLFDLVRDDVLEATNNKQQPFTYGSVPGRQDFYFVSK